MRYQRIHTKIWHDEKFASLSPAGQRLFLYFLSSPHSNLLGLYVLKPEYACGDLKSLPKDFTKDLTEVLGKGLAEYDTTNSVVLLPRYLSYNPLTNPNQLKAAVSIIKEIPQTPLLRRLKALVEVLPEGLTKGLLEVLPKVLPKPVTVTVTEAVTEIKKKTCAESCEKSTAHPPAQKIEFDGGFKNITAEDKNRWARAYLALDIEQELIRMEAWVIANPKNRKSNWQKFIVNWLSRSQDRTPGIKKITWKDIEAREKELAKKKHDDHKPILPLIPTIQEITEAKREKYDRKAENCTNPQKAECQSPYCPSTCRFRGKTGQILEEEVK